MESVFRSHVARIRAEGASVLLSSHILSEVEQLCDRVTIIRAGVAVERGSLKEMRHLTSSAFTVTTDLDVAIVAALPGVLHARRLDGALSFDVETDAAGRVLSELTKHRIDAITITPPSLEELFLRHYGDPGASKKVL